LIIVESPGFQTTVQDLGRPGYGVRGVSASGACDTVSLRVANRAVGNPPGSAALEMTMSGGRYRFEGAAVAAVTGAECTVRVDGRAVECWVAFDIEAGALLEIGQAASGSRMYLAVAGGFAVPPFLGSASTHLMTGLGGFEGRALRKGDRLAIGIASPVRGLLRKEVLARLRPRKTLRVTYAPQTDWFADGQRAAFVESPYRVTPDANRMGLRLEGTALSCARGAGMVTEGVALGAVQIPPEGQPIILFVEQQTTGGYPKIANVIRADLASVGQLRPSDEVRFEWVSFETARALYREQEELLLP
jgi:5-oxoprolinase (ATP-hydrolysing) subunit C